MATEISGSEERRPFLVRPAEDAGALRTALDALAALGVRRIAPTPTLAVDAARHRGLNIGLADGFALATAQAHEAHLASFDPRVRRALPNALSLRWAWSWRRSCADTAAPGVQSWLDGALGKSPSCS